MFKELIPENLRTVRTARSLSVQDLSSSSGIPKSAIYRMEKGERSPSQEELSQLCVSLNCLESTLMVPMPPSGGFKHFRAYKSISARALDAFEACVTIIVKFISTLFEMLALDCVRLPQWGTGPDGKSPQDIAKSFRKFCKINLYAPIPNVLKIVESFGVICVPMDLAHVKIDGLSTFIGETPIIFFDSMASGDRLRFTIAHEVGHLIMHREQPPNDLTEKEANAFAAEWLMPEESIRPQLVNLTIPKLLELKGFWQTSMAALLNRAGTNGLSVISKSHSDLLWRIISSNGWRRREPLALSVEEPRLLNYIIEYLCSALKCTLNDLAVKADLTEDLLRLVLGSTLPRTAKSSGSTMNINDPPSGGHID